MKLRYLYRLCFLLFTILLVAGCKEIEAIEITQAKVTFYQKSDGGGVPQSEAITLSPSQMQFVQGWLNANRTGWSSHKPMATLLPRWCMALTTHSGKAVGFCRYGASVVLRSLKSEIEKPLSEQDNALFLKNIETVNGNLLTQAGRTFGAPFNSSLVANWSY